MLAACGGAEDVSVAPELDSFSVTPSSVTAGAPATVTWSWTFARAPAPEPTCTIDQGVGAVASGATSTLTLTADTVFTLSCGNSAGTASRQVTVTAAGGSAAPVLATFTASPSSLVSGTPTDVTWTWTYANSPKPAPTCTIDQGVGTVTSGTTSRLTLSGDTVFTLNCSSSAGTASRQVTVTAAASNAAPVLATFTASPSSVIAGTPTDVTWTWAYANSPSPAPSCSIDQGVGAVTSGTSTRVTLSSDTVFTLTCTNSVGTHTRQVTVSRVNATVAPVMGPLVATPASVPAGTPTNVTWTWTYSNQPTPSPSCSIDQGVGILTSGTTTRVTLSADTVFTVTCTNSAGSATAQVTVKLAPPTAPALSTFTASPSLVPAGASTSVSWNWTYSNTPSPAPTCSIDQGVGAVTPGAFRQVSLTADTLFTLTCTNAAGADSRQVTLTVARCGPAGATRGWIADIVEPGLGLTRADRAVWIDTGLFVYDGGDYNTQRRGAIWNRSTRTWSPINLTGAPQSISAFGLAWTGTKVVLWGGMTTQGIVTVSRQGWLYDPATDSWSQMSSNGSPAARHQPIVQWTGTHVSVFDGTSFLATNTTTGLGHLDSGLWDPTTDTWTVVPFRNLATPAGAGTRAVWAGNGLLAFGGSTESSTNSARYNFWAPPATEWPATPCSLSGARRFSSLVWTGTSAVTWGGQDGANAGPYHGTGFAITPGAATCTSTAIPASTGSPSARSGHTAVWTGSRMIVFGGRNGSQTFSDGASYDPQLGQWSPLEAGTPGTRSGHQAFWTGTEMIIWGGTGSSLLAGCVYKP
jgi:hypothetical protein